MSQNYKELKADICCIDCVFTSSYWQNKVYKHSKEKKTNHTKKNLLLKYFLSQKNIILLSLESNNISKNFLRCKWSKLPRDLLLLAHL